MLQPQIVILFRIQHAKCETDTQLLGSIQLYKIKLTYDIYIKVNFNLMFYN